MKKFVKRLATAGAICGILELGYRIGQGHMLGTLSGYGAISHRNDHEITQSLRDNDTLECKLVCWVADQQKKRIIREEQES